MKDLVLLLIHLLNTLARLLGPGGAKAIVADSLQHETATPGDQPFTKTRTQSVSTLSILVGILVAFLQSEPYSTFRDYSQTLNSTEIPRSTQETEISVAFYLSLKKQA